MSFRFVTLQFLYHYCIQVVFVGPLLYFSFLIFPTTIYVYGNLILSVLFVIKLFAGEGYRLSGWCCVHHHNIWVWGTSCSSSGTSVLFLLTTSTLHRLILLKVISPLFSSWGAGTCSGQRTHRWRSSCSVVSCYCHRCGVS